MRRRRCFKSGGLPLWGSNCVNNIGPHQRESICSELTASEDCEEKQNCESKTNHELGSDQHNLV